MKYRAMFPDTFIDVEADSEEAAVKKAKEIFIAGIEAGEDEPIVWKTAGWETEENDDSNHGSALPR